MGSVVGSVESGDMLSATWSGPLARGQEMQLFSLIAAKTEDMDADVGNCISLEPNAAALALRSGPAIAAAGGYGGLRADLGVMATDHLAAYGATRCGELLAADSPVDVDWSFSDGTLAIACSRKNILRLALAGAAVKVDNRPIEVSNRAGDGCTITLDAGKHTLCGAVPLPSLLEEYRGRLTSAFKVARAARLQAPVVSRRADVVTAPEIKPTWQASLGHFPFDMQVFPCEKATLLAVAAGKNILLFDAAGTLVRKLEADDLVRLVHYWPEAGVLAAGCRDFRIIAFDPANGQRRWVFQSTDINPEFKKAGISGWFDRSPGENKGIHALTSGVFLDGHSQLLAGTASTVEAIGQDGKLLRSMNGGVGVVTDITLLDCGEGEVRLFPARLFGHFRLQHTSSRTPDQSAGLNVGPFAPRLGSSTHVSNIGNGYAAIKAVDLDSDGQQELVGLFNGTLNGIHVWDRAGHVRADAAFGPGAASPRPSWQNRVQTPNMRGLAIADLDGDGKREIAIITARGFVIVLNHRCEKLWARALPSDPTAIAALAAESGRPGRLVVACRTGSVYVQDAVGKILNQGKVDGLPTRLVLLNDVQIALTTADGQLAAYRVR
jgi:outer membrane protein assembly factor BamB